MFSGEIALKNNHYYYIYDIIVEQIVYSDVVHRALYNIAMHLVENSLVN